MRDIKAIKKLQKTIDDALATAERLANPSTTIQEKNKWYSAWLGLRNAAEAMPLVVQNTESAMNAEKSK